MAAPNENLSLLDQHIFQQNQRIIELSDNLKKFCDAGQRAIYDAEEKSEEKNYLIKWSVIGVAVCAVIFGGGGYLVGRATDTISISNAKAELKEANDRASAAVEASKAAAADFEKRLTDETQKIRAGGGWAASPTGQLAKRFFDDGWGEVAAKCKSPVWDIKKTEKGTFCVPKRRDILGGDGNQYGWKIP